MQQTIACQHEPKAARGMCNPCYQRWYRAEGAPRAECHPLRQRGGLDGFCHPCRSKRRAAEDPEYKRRLNLAHRLQDLYGIGIRDYEAKVAAQNGRCAICGIVPEGRLQVDHNHVTGVIRDLLCGPCNSLVGQLGDVGPDRQVDVFKYLLRWAAA